MTGALATDIHSDNSHASSGRASVRSIRNSMREQEKAMNVTRAKRYFFILLEFCTHYVVFHTVTDDDELAIYDGFMIYDL